jgi:hypothetical protein
MQMRVLLAVHLLLALGCSNSEEIARTSFQECAEMIEARLPDLIAEYDKDGARVTALSTPMVWSFNRKSRRDSKHEGTIRFGMRVTSANGTESEVRMLSYYQYEDGKWACKKFEITSGRNRPVEIMGEDLRSSADSSKLASALVNIE